MNLTTYFLAVFYFIFGAEINNADFTNKTDAFLKKYVDQKSVKYSAIKANPQELNNIIALISSEKVTSLTKEERISFYINAYNILVIASVVKNFPLKSPLDVSGFFDKKTHNVGGEQLTLNDIENNKIRKAYGDPRIHFALVCAGKGCPPLTNEAFTATNLYSKLDQLTKNALNSDFIKVDYLNKKVSISQIFEWYQADFGKTIDDSILFINKYRDKVIPLSFTKNYYNYDWNINGY